LEHLKAACPQRVCRRCHASGHSEQNCSVPPPPPPPPAASSSTTVTLSAPRSADAADTPSGSTDASADKEKADKEKADKEKADKVRVKVEEGETG
jgi:hypothetical protein